ncbi:hypothetical protein AB4124_13750 [Paenibacillus sp. 2KB_20]|uniref:hypothetical protein n=1 Tax=Paenibacillus sp. 2KB_20 TaxID=3232977 RepID=UPI003F985C59
MKKAFTVFSLFAFLFVMVLSPTGSSVNAKSPDLPEGYKAATPSQIKEVNGIIAKSSKSLNNAFTSKGNSLKYGVVEGHEEIALVSTSEVDQNGNAKLVVYGVDTKAEKVQATTYETIQNGDTTTLRIINDCEECNATDTVEIELTADGKIIKDGQTYSQEDIYELIKQKQGEATEEITPMAWSCTDYVGNMCMYMSGWGAAELCALSIFAGGIAALGCVAVYGIIALWGCSSAIDLIC